MMKCPYCDAENIEGTDLCQQCGQALVDLHLAPPNTGVERALMTDRVDKLGSNQPVAVAPEKSVGEVLDLMVEKHIGCVFVVDNQKLVGVFTERDALLKLDPAEADMNASPVSQFMTQNPQDIVDDAKIAFAVRMMDLGSYRHIPVVDSAGALRSVISVRDILKYLTAEIAAA